MKKLLTQEQARELFDYDPETGVFTWRVAVYRKIQPGRKAGCLADNGYVLIRAIGTLYKAHRLAWLYVHGEWPEHDIDHINGVRSDNRLVNLRAVTRQVNLQNRTVTRAVSGFMGVQKGGNLYYAKVGHKGKQILLGSFPTAELAYARYVEAKRLIHEGCML